MAEDPTTATADVQESDTMRMTRMRMLVAAASLAGLGTSSVALAQDGAVAPEEAPATDPGGSASGEEPDAEAASSNGDSDGAGAGGADYDRELLTIEEEVHSLKEQVFRAKATLQLLKEIVVQGTAAGSRATVWHENKLGRGYTVESIAYYLDGQGKFSKADPTGGLDEMREFKVFEGAVPPGTHSVTVNLRLRGNGFGVFSYVKDYTFNVQSSHSFVAEEGKNCSVRVVSDERRGIGRSFTERPNVQFETTCARLSDSGGAAE